MKKHVIFPAICALTVALTIVGCQKEHPPVLNKPDPGRPPTRDLINSTNTSNGQRPDSIAGDYSGAVVQR